ncbi:calaxin-like isoform X2 [Phyllopteryx taeniolatus]|uniref:calaxin-like isoform X2 n=1 Tax=Phyllopteryx taeniolatus TaxID=161469 RepID=UPI002AD25ED1|nr:calaxin-like isoform X2 [Phyllopteryx taeniolatus]
MSKRLIQNLAKTISKQVDRYDELREEQLGREEVPKHPQQRLRPHQQHHHGKRFRARRGQKPFSVASARDERSAFQFSGRSTRTTTASSAPRSGWRAFCFHVYDLTGDDYISREEMLLMVRNCLRLHGEEDPYDGIKDLVEITLKRMDHDNDDKLSFDDYEKSVKELDIVLEAFGTCLPNATKIEMFEQRVFNDKSEHR